MRYFLDTEFIERGHRHPIELISIGVASEDGREFYACNRDFNAKHASPWVRENVLALLPDPKPDPVWRGGSPRINMEAEAWMSYERIRDRLYEFTAAADPFPPQFWGYYCAFDYVILSQLMGGMEQWPSMWGAPMMYDLRQHLNERNKREASQPDDAPHNALQDARWIRDTFLAHEHEAETQP